MAQSLERIASMVQEESGGNTTIWTPAAGETGILAFFWIHALDGNAAVILKGGAAGAIEFFRIKNDNTNPLFPTNDATGEILVASTDTVDKVHVGQIKVPIEGAVSNANPLIMNVTGGTSDIMYSLTVVKNA